jgi:hypothetical protein
MNILEFVIICHYLHDYVSFIKVVHNVVKINNLSMASHLAFSLYSNECFFTNVQIVR